MYSYYYFYKFKEYCSLFLLYSDLWMNGKGIKSRLFVVFVWRTSHRLMQWLPMCAALLLMLFSVSQRNMWRVTPAAPLRPSCRKTLVFISFSVRRATLAALSPASRLVSRLWRARERSFAPKPTRGRDNSAPPLPSASCFVCSLPQKGQSWSWASLLICLKDSLNRTAGGFGCLVVVACKTRAGSESLKPTERVQAL